MVQSAFVKWMGIELQDWIVPIYSNQNVNRKSKHGEMIMPNTLTVLAELSSLSLLLIPCTAQTLSPAAVAAARLHSLVCWIFHYFNPPPFIKTTAKWNAMKMSIYIGTIEL